MWCQWLPGGFGLSVPKFYHVKLLLRGVQDQLAPGPPGVGGSLSREAILTRCPWGGGGLSWLPAEHEARMAARLEELGSIGRRGRGLWRFPFTPDYEQATTLVGGWMRQAGLEVSRDPIGNLIGRASGSSDRVVATGSHLDTVRDGGRFDGALGVVGAISAASFLLAEYGRPRKTLEVIAYTGEEGARFPVCLLGSRWMAGLITPEDLLSADPDGVTLASALASLGQSNAVPPAAGRTDLDAFIELHTEQGPVLEAAGSSLGVVDRIMGQCEVEVTVRGRPDHAGTTPMAMRSDALVAAAKLILAMRAEVLGWSSPTVFTVGRLTVKPGSGNVVPAEVTFSIDLRDPDPDFYRRSRERLRDMCRGAAAADKVVVTWRDLFTTDPVACDPGLSEILSRAATKLGHRPITLPSGAGHDSMVLAGLTRVGLLFVPSAGGRSHCPEEHTPSQQCYLGAAVLAEALRELAY